MPRIARVRLLKPGQGSSGAKEGRTYQSAGPGPPRPAVPRTRGCGRTRSGPPAMRRGCAERVRQPSAKEADRRGAKAGVRGVETANRKGAKAGVREVETWNRRGEKAGVKEVETADRRGGKEESV